MTQPPAYRRGGGSESCILSREETATQAFAASLFSLRGEGAGRRMRGASSAVIDWSLRSTPSSPRCAPALLPAGEKRPIADTLPNELDGA
jgi:hypothetical protein